MDVAGPVPRHPSSGPGSEAAEGGVGTDPGSPSVYPVTLYND